MTPETLPEPYLTAAEVSRRYRISERTLANWREKHRGPKYYRVGKTPLYTASDLEEFIRSCAVLPAANCRPRPAASVAE